MMVSSKMMLVYLPLNRRTYYCCQLILFILSKALVHFLFVYVLVHYLEAIVVVVAAAAVVFAVVNVAICIFLQECS